MGVHVQTVAAEHVEAVKVEAVECEAIERQNEMAARMRRMEVQHTNDKVNWKIKLECALAGARQSAAEKEEYRGQYQELNARYEQAVEAQNQVVALHNETIKQHAQEKKTLEDRITHSDQEYKEFMIRQKRELQLEITELTAKNRLLHVTNREQDLAHKAKIEEQAKKYKQEKEEMNRRLSLQRSQIDKLRDSHGKAAQMCDKLAKAEAKHSKDQQDAKYKQQNNARLITQLREELKTLKEKEVELKAANKENNNLKEQLEAAKKTEQKLERTVKDLKRQHEEHHVVLQRLDEENASWKATAAKLETCVDNLVEMESKSASTYQEQIDSMLTSLQKQMEDTALEQEELAWTCTQLQDEAAAWKCQYTELEKTLAQAKKESVEDEKQLVELRQHRKEQEEVLHKQQAELVDCQEAYVKVEQCVEDLMQLESESTAHYQKQIDALVEHNKDLTRQVEQLEWQKNELVHENAGLRVDDELGLEAIHTPYMKKVIQENSLCENGTLSTAEDDDDDDDSVPHEQHVVASEDEIEIEMYH